MTVIDITETQQTSLDNCDKEPVHIPGHIQDFAVCLSTDTKLKTIMHCSENAGRIFNKSAAEILGMKLSDLLDKDIIHNLNNTFSLSSVKFQRERATSCNIGNTECEIWVHISEGFPIIEIEEIRTEKVSQNEAVRNVRSLLALLGRTDNPEAVYNNAVAGLRNITEFDRVMLYQFDNNGNGDIKAEAKAPGLESFLGLRFPSWDIPKQAREILKKVPIRVIADVYGKPVSLSCNETDAKPLDLTLAVSRGQSPVHSEYLNNMGVRSTMTLSIVVGEQLWGLFAFHHMSPRVIGPSMRGSVELFTQFFSLQMEQRLEKQRNSIRSTMRTYKNTVLTEVNKTGSKLNIAKTVFDYFGDYIQADGVSIIVGGEVSNVGDTPESQITKQIASLLLTDSQHVIASTECIEELGFDSSPCAGALAISIGPENSDALIFYRKEAMLSVSWAGAPEKNILEDKDGPRLVPRGSFKSYSETVNNKSVPWEQNSLTAARELRSVLAEAEYEWLHKTGRQSSIYIDELNHRVRNILALTRSLVRQTKQSSTSLESYAKSLEQRISALGAAHDLAANRSASGLEIKKVFEMEAEPFLTNNENQINIFGQDLIVQASVAPLFALITHELMTNCVKYGALSVPNGRIDINISNDKHRVTIVWQEFNGPVVRKPKKQGFGLSLIETFIPYELDGKSQVDFLPEGLKVTFTLPLDMVDSVSVPTTTNESYSKPDIARAPETALVLEDSLMVAIDLSDMLKNLGIKEVQQCSTVASAKVMLQDYLPDFALLDISLRDEQSFEFAEILLKQSVPFCFATGYGSNYSSPKKFDSIDVLTKPVELDLLRISMNKACKI